MCVCECVWAGDERHGDRGGVSLGEVHGPTWAKRVVRRYSVLRACLEARRAPLGVRGASRGGGGRGRV